MYTLALTNLTAIDLGIVFIILAIVVGAAIYTRRYTRSVADFLSANRCAGRYLLTVASGMSGLGAITIVAQWEQVYQAGFSAGFWGQMMAPLGLLLALSGWIIYRYRETRSMTLAQLMEKRYSRKFRIFSGSLCWISGILNFGIFPAVTARFFIYFLDLPVHTYVLPGLDLTLNLTLGVVMGIELLFAIMIALSGGQVSVMVTDFLQGQLSNIIFLVLLITMLVLFPWETIVDTLKQAPEGQSKLNPFDISRLPDFNISFFVMMLFITIYNFMVWQGTQGYNSSAINPHEAKMAGILAQFRSGVTYLLIPLAAVCAYVLMHAPIHEAATIATQATLDGLGDAQLAKQLTTTVALSNVLPVGIMGMFAAVMIMAAVSTDTTYLHSWGSIFIQDVLMPWRQLRGHEDRLTPETHLKWLKRSIVGVAIFAWCFSMIFPLKEFILMYFQVTGAIFLGGGGAVLVGALYWKRGTTSGAWAAMITGSTLAVGGVLINNVVWPMIIPALQSSHPENTWLMNLPEVFWLNGMQLGFLSSLSAIAAYILVSLIAPNPQIEMDELLHRGEFSSNDPEGPDHVAPPRRGLAALGFTEEFTKNDKIVYILQLSWVSFFFFAFIIICIWQLFFKWTEDWWANWWFFNLIFTGTAGAITTVWFLIGGAKDLKRLFERLKTIQRDENDDGTVEKHLTDKSS
ncbi:sodium:solute symporter [Kiritimatiellota bacterium B12222]|nr:sodium:solute symporter [Kiritimatiellota bacterium B12222]